MTQQTTSISGPSWHLTTEYSGPASAEVENDLKRVGALLDEIETLNAALAAHERPEAVEAAQRVYQRSVTVQELLDNVTVYANCLLSADSRDEAAQSLRGRLLGYQKRCAELLEPLSQFVHQASDEAIAAYLSDPVVREAEFLVRHARRRRHERLPLAQEQLIGALSQDGIHAWGRMYTQVSATMTCEVTVGGETRRLGLAHPCTRTGSSVTRSTRCSRRPNELKRWMTEAWREWYGDVMCEADPMFWASKLHFFISGRSFYNFPYLFGYLFSMNLYLRKDEFDGAFYRRYVELLRDTGRMAAEELAAKHLRADLTQPAFWRDIVSCLEGRVAAFETLARASSDEVVQLHRKS